LTRTPSIRTERSKNFVANFLSGLFTYEIQNPDKDDTSVVATVANQNVPVLSTVFEIWRWSIHWCSSRMAMLPYVFSYLKPRLLFQ